MKHLLFFLLCAFLFTSCSPEAIRARQWNRYLKDLKNDPPVAADTATGGYGASAEIDILDNLLKKYPGRQQVRTVTKTEIKTLPGKTIYVEVPVKKDSLRAVRLRDSLFFAFDKLLQQEQASSQLRAEVARLRMMVLNALSSNACLPDTLIRFPQYGITLKVQRGNSGKYGFTIVEAPQQVPFDTQVREEHNGRVVNVEKVMWRQEPLWRDEWFWLFAVLLLYGIWITYLRIRDAKPAASR